MNRKIGKEEIHMDKKNYWGAKIKTKEKTKKQGTKKGIEKLEVKNKIKDKLKKEKLILKTRK
jgi:hypothetical protein